MAAYIKSLVAYLRNNTPEAQLTTNVPRTPAGPRPRARVPPGAAGVFEWPDEGLDDALELFADDETRSSVFSYVSRERVDLS